MLAGALALAALALVASPAEAAKGSDAATGNEGYVWIDGVYNWDEIRSPVGTPLAIASDGATSVNFPSGFEFTFYGTTYGPATPDAYVAEDGFLSFLGGVGTTWEPFAIPNAAAPNRFIAPYWMDLDLNSASCTSYVNPPAGSTQMVYTHTLGTSPNRRYVVEWDGVSPYDYDFVCTRFQTFELKLFEGSDILELHLKGVNSFEPLAGGVSQCWMVTMGIERDGAAGLQLDAAVPTPTQGCSKQVAYTNTGFRLWKNAAVDATDQAFTLNTGASVTFQPSVSDDPLTYTVVQALGAGQGTITPVPTGVQYGKKPTWTYTAPATCGTYTYKYRVSDGYDNPQTATVTFTILCQNQPPTLTVPSGALTVKGGKSILVPGVTVQDPDAGSLPVTFTLTAASGTLEVTPAGGVVVLGGNPAASLQLRGSVADLTSTLATLRYQATMQCGIAWIDVAVDDGGNTGVGGAKQAFGGFGVTVTDCTIPNNPPQAEGKTVVVPQGETEAVFGLVYSDPDGDVLTVETLVQPALGRVTGTAPDLLYTRVPKACGNDILRYRVVDSHGAASSAATVTFELQCPPNQPPTAHDLQVLLHAGSTRSFSPLGTDPEGSPLTFQAVQQPAHGYLDTSGRLWRYTPELGWCGIDQVRYVASDGKDPSPPATIELQVACPTNTPPVAEGAALATRSGVNLALTLLGYDADGDELSFVLVDPPLGELRGEGPQRVYVPPAGFLGTDAFSFRTFDGTDFSGTAVVTVLVEGQPAAEPRAVEGQAAPAGRDSDGDGFPDHLDNCPVTASKDLADRDGDGVGDACDTQEAPAPEPGAALPDADRDGIPDAQDICPADFDPAQQDMDRDGLGDACDADRDGDGIRNVDDNCPSLASLDLGDLDGDTIGDPCDPDVDNDGVLDWGPAGRIDNCPRLPNPDQRDTDGDGVGDLCDADVLGIGTLNAPCTSEACRPAAPLRAMAQAPEAGALTPGMAVALGAGIAGFLGLVGATVALRRRGD